MDARGFGFCRLATLMNSEISHSMSNYVSNASQHSLEKYREAAEFCKSGDYNRACLLIEQILEAKELLAPTLLMKAKILFKKDKFQEALDLAEKSFSIEPTSEALHVVAVISFGFGRFVDAIRMGERVLKADKENFQIRHYMAASYRSLGEVDKSVPLRFELIKLQPNNDLWWTSLYLDLVYWKDASVETLSWLSTEYSHHLKKKYNEVSRFNSVNNKSKNIKIRVGFISPDLRNHSIAYFLLPFIYQLNRNIFDLFLYSKVRDIDEDQITTQFEKIADKFIRVNTLGEVTDQIQSIRSDQLDIIFDVAGLTSNSGLPLLFHRVAKVQASFLGYPGSTGFESIDYCLVPEAVAGKIIGGRLLENNEFTEKLALFPSIPYCYRAHIKRPLDRYKFEYQVKPPPFLKNGYITFGCCSHQARYNDSLLETWGKILNQVPESKLLLEIRIGDDTSRTYLLDRMSRLGIKIEQVEILQLVPENQYLTYHRIDIALDPFPCNGGTTSLDALWMGVPLITLSGFRFRERLGESFLLPLGLGNFVASDVAEYISLARKLAADPERLTQTRRCQRTALLRSNLANESLSTRLLEQFICKATNEDSAGISSDLVVASGNKGTDTLQLKNYVFDDSGNRMPVDEASQILEELVRRIQGKEAAELSKSVNRLKNLAIFILRTDPENVRAVHGLAIAERLLGNESVANEYFSWCE